MKKTKCCGLDRVVFLFLMVVMLHGQASGQIGSTLPSNRVVDWTKAGYHQNPDDNIPTIYKAVFHVPSPSHTGSDSYNIALTLDSARTMIDKMTGDNSDQGFVCVRFSAGIYKIDKPIYFPDQAFHNIVLRGNGADSTIIKYAGPVGSDATIFSIHGHIKDTTRTEVTGYNRNTNTITLSSPRPDITEGDYIMIQLPTGNWNDALSIRGNTQRGDYISQIVKVVKVQGDAIKLLDNFALMWDIGHSNGNNVVPYIHKVVLAQELGFQDMKLVTDEKPYKKGSHIRFNLAVNCWVKNIESDRPVQQHVQCTDCAHLEIRHNYFHDAFTYGSEGGNGSGSGVSLAKSTLCLVENNVFKHLRHSVSLSLGSSRNVVGYNYTYDQYSDAKDKSGKIYRTKLSDIILHGFYPFANLIEGNYVGSLKADDWWGSNGPYNTFFRNYCRDGLIILEKTNYTNVLGNEARLQIDNSTGVIDKYGIHYTQSGWNPSMRDKDYLSDISYYHKTRPSFLPSTYTWPPIGPPTVVNGQPTSQNIPARTRAMH